MMTISRSLRARTTKQQTRLAFSPLPSSSPAKDQDSTANQDRLVNVRHTGGRSTPDSLPPTPQPSSQADLQTNGDESENDVLPSTKRRRLARESESEEQPTPTRKSTRLSRSSPLRRHTSSSFNASDNGGSPKASTMPELGEPETTGDEDDVLVTKPIQRRGQRKKAAEDPFVVDDDRVEYISSDEEPAPRARAKPKRSNGDDWLAADDEIEYITSGDEVPHSSRNKVKKSKLRRPNRHEQEELEDDLADLRDSDQSEEASRKTLRTRGGPVTTQKDKAREHFDLLKRRRAGEKIPRVLDSDEEEGYKEAEPVDIDNIVVEDGLLGAPHDISEVDSETHAVNLEDEPAEDDFVVDDVSSRRLGLPHPDIPLEFTSYASAKPKDLFIHVIEWLVKNRIAPAFDRDDPIYKLSLSKVSDQVTAQAGSRLISSAWTAEFKYAILARPNIRMTYLDELEDGDDGIRTCDACNRTNHPARYDFVLTGEPYKKRNLEPVNDESEDDDEDDDTQAYDEAGHLLPSQRTHFYLGRFCAANAEMGHKLIHWQYHVRCP